MKKMTIFTTLLLLGATTGVTASAEVLNQAESKNTIHFKAGEGVVTEPINPVDPGKPVPSPIDPEDGGNTGTGNKGPLSIDYVSNIAFGTQEIASGTMTYNAMNENPFVQVTDVRGSKSGWSLYAKMTEFTSEDKKDILTGATFSLNSGEVKTTPENISSAPSAEKNVVFNNQEAKLVMSAQADEGHGTWVEVFSGEHESNKNVTLEVPAGVADADIDYVATMFWELIDAPSK